VQNLAPTATASSARRTTTGGSVPLCVDLDGTLIRSDMLWESTVRLLRRNPLWLPALLLWWLRGRACLKAQIARRVTVDAAMLPYQEDLLDFLRAEARAGRRLVLATASDEALALPVARQVGLFAETLASNGRLNLRGANKARVLVERFGERGFDYAGNSSVDLPVWARARQAVVVNASPRLLRRAQAVANIGGVFGEAPARLGEFWVAMKPTAWPRHLPVLAALFIGPSGALAANLGRAGLAFGGLCLCFSAMTVLCSLVRLDSDRVNPERRDLPFASGYLPLSWGLSGAPLLLLAAAAVCLALPLAYAAVLVAFVAVAVCSIRWDGRFVVTDMLIMASFDFLRVLAGHAATGRPAPWWWLAIWAAVSLGLAMLALRLRAAHDPQAR
jgi:phosphoserine phosphatase